MDAMLGTLCALGFVLGVITVVGHGIWVAVAWLVRLGNPSPQSVNERAPALCPVCRGQVSAAGQACGTCGWPMPLAPGRRAAAGLNAISREIVRLKQAGLLEPAAFERLSTALDAERAELVKPVVLIEPIAMEMATAVPAATLPPARAVAPSAPVEREQPVEIAAQPAGDVLSRAQQYALARASAAREPQDSSTPQRHWSELLLHFMEEKNIRWGELIGGLLIVCCSVALVISFWSQIAQRPFLKFFLFNGVTAGLFGVGFYSQRRWKLRTTSQGLLTIAVLLVPLNLLAIAAFSEGAAPPSFALLAGEAISVLLFSALVYTAGRTITSPSPIPLTIGVVGSAAAELLVRRLVAPAADVSTLAAVSLVPLACYLIATAWTLLAAQSRVDADAQQQAGGRFTLLGTTTFAAALALGLLLVKSGEPWQTLCRLAPLASICGVPALATGLVLMRRLKQPELAGLHTAAISIAVIGAGVLVSGLALGWTRPASLMLVGIADFIMFAAVAFALELPAALLLAVAVLVPAWLAAFHAIAGQVPWEHVAASQVAHALLSAASGSALVPLAALAAAAAWAARRIGRPLHARFLAIAAAAVAVGSLALVIGYGFGRSGDAGATWVLLFYAAAMLVAAMRLGATAVWIGSGLLLMASVQALVFRYGQWLGWDHPWLLALLGHATVMTIAAGVVSGVRERGGERALAWRDAALLSSLVALPLVLSLVASDGPAKAAGYGCWIAADWLALAWLADSALLFTAFQLALSFSTAMFAAGVGPSAAWTDPRRLQAMAVAVALLNLGWVGIRLGLRRSETARRLLCPPWPSVDRVLTGLLIVGLLTVASCGALPGVLEELAPRSAVESEAWRDLPHRGIFSTTAVEAGSWLWMLALLSMLVARQWERFSRTAVLGAMLVLWAACPLLAGYEPNASASALRWCVAGYGLLLSLPVWFRGRVLMFVRPAGWPELEVGSAGLAQRARWLLVSLSALPALVLTLQPALAAIAGDPLFGPGPGTFFVRLGPFGSFLVPLAAVCAMLLGHAIRERLSAYAFAAGLVLNLATTLGFLLSAISAGSSVGTVECLRLLQLNAIVSGGFALAWLSATAWWPRPDRRPKPRPDGLLRLQSALPGMFVLLLVAPSLMLLIVEPSSGAPLFEAAGVWGWTAAAMALAAACFCHARCGNVEHPIGRWLSLFAIALFAVAALAAFEASRWDVGDWLAYHTLMAGLLAVALMLLASDVVRRVWSRQIAVASWTVVAGTWICLLAVRTWLGDPDSPWWSVGSFGALALIFAVLACAVERRKFLWIAAALLNLAVTIWWGERPLWRPTRGWSEASALALLQVNAIALALPVLAWLFAELRFIRPGRGAKAVTLHSLAAGGALAIVAFVAAISLAGDFDGHYIEASQLLNGLTIAAVAAAIIACLWDANARWPIADLYLLGLVGLGMVVDGYNLSPRWLVWTGMMLAAAYSLATSYLWSRRQGLLALAHRLRIPQRSGPALGGVSWIVPANWLLSCAVMVACFGVELTFPEQPLRLVSGNAAMLQAVAVGMLARGRRKSQLRAASLGFAVLGAVAWGWAWIDPASPERMLDRAVVATVALAAMSVVYGTAGKFLPPSAWVNPARRMLPALLTLGGVSLCAVVAMEVHAYATAGQVAIAGPAIAAVIVALGALACAALIAAVVPGRDPLRLSERGRTIYVYASEGLLALMLLHVRLTLPWLFTGFFLRYWPLVVMLVAFVGVGLGEWFRRKRQAVLAEPLERTGVLLPLLPVLGYWAAPARGVHYSLQLVAVGMLYGLLSVTRRSFGFGLLAALAANGGLWFFLNEQGEYGLLVHPQLWLIPPALSVLVAAYLNRDRLNDSQMTTIRYLAAVTIYVSSTADIFVNGVAQAPCLPLVLAGLSIVGVLVGILLQVRAFLFLGTAFLVLSLFTIIWHAAVDLEQTWLWAASGIVTGILIIAMFAAFEKKRDDVLVLVERLREWEA